MSSRPDAPIQRAAIGGFSIAYTDEGEGLPCLLLHGFPFDHTQWRAQRGVLGGDVRLVLPDLRGHGASDAPPPPYRMSDFADDVRALLDRLAIERVVLGGLSMGGYIALAFAERYPERLAGLVLMATRADADSAEARQGRMETASRVREAGAAAIADALAGRILGERHVPDWLETTVRNWITGTSPDGLAGSLAAMASRPDSTPFLAAIGCPTLVVVGSDDHLTPPSCARAIADGIPGAGLHEIAGAGHLVALERPDEVNPILRRFLERRVR